MIQDLKNFMEKINEDQALRERMGKIVRESTQENVFDNCNAVAAELGYTITQEDLQTYADEYQADLSDEELDKVAGGTSAVTAVITISAIWGIPIGSTILAHKIIDK